MNAATWSINYFLVENLKNSAEIFSSVLLLQVNGLDVSDCSHDEAVKILSAASEPIIVEVKHRNSAAKDDTDKVSDDNGLKVSSKCSREIQTDPADDVTNNVCDQCGDLYNSYYNYNCDIQLDPEDSFIYPELQYEVKMQFSKNLPPFIELLTSCYPPVNCEPFILLQKVSIDSFTHPRCQRCLSASILLCVYFNFIFIA